MADQLPDPQEWYYAKDDQQFGPVPLETLKKLVAEGSLGSQNLVWRAGFDSWRPVGEVPELVSRSAPPPLPSKKPPQTGGPGG